MLTLYILILKNLGKLEKNILIFFFKLRRYLKVLKFNYQNKSNRKKSKLKNLNVF